MTPRLLSFLNLIQDAISRQGGTKLEGTRMVSFHKNIARLVIKDGGALQVQSFALADGQMCVKAALYWPGIATPAFYAVYPTTEEFSWEDAGEKVAQMWIEGPIAAGINPLGESDAAPSLSRLVAAS
jgi:hypothetical protein